MTTTTTTARVPASATVLEALRTELADLESRDAALALEEAAAWAVGGQTLDRADQSVSADAETILAARLRLAEIPLERARLRLKTLPLQRAVSTAESDERTRLIEGIDAQRKPLVAQLNAKLIEAASINEELARLDAEAETRLGPQMARLSWHELRNETADAPSRLHDWRRFATAHGMF